MWICIFGADPLILLSIRLQICHAFLLCMFLWPWIPSCMPHHNLINPDSDSLTQQSLSDGEEQLDRLQQAELTRNTCMSMWRAGAVQAWLEVVMGMPMYVRACSENIKSGKVKLWCKRSFCCLFTLCLRMGWLDLCSIGAAKPDRWGFRAGSGYQ